MNDKSWQIDYARIAVLLLPTFLRRPLLVRYAQLMITSISQIHVQLITYRDETKYELGMTGQVCRLRALLNDIFDAELRRIIIVDSEQKPSATVVWQREEKRGSLIGLRDNGGLVISCRGYEGASQPDFEIVIPLQLTVDEKRLIALVDTHKLAGKKYKITKLI